MKAGPLSPRHRHDLHRLHPALRRRLPLHGLHHRPGPPTGATQRRPGLPLHELANFILCRVTGRDAAGLKMRLAHEYGVFVRYFNKPGLQDHIRISVGRPQDTDVLLDALQNL